MFAQLRWHSIWIVMWGMVMMPPAFADEPVMTDITITDKVEDELIFDSAITSANVDVQTTSGVVTLAGIVDSLMAKERAARIASTVRGVRSVVNRLTVKPYKSLSDKQVKEAVENALWNDPATESYEVTVTVQDGKVTLDGSVDSYQEAVLCANVAKTVSGVKAVEDSLRVDYAQDRPPYEIKLEIEARLKWDVLVDNGLINVNVDKNGQVALSGTVGSSAEKARAKADAWVAGVSAVDDSKLEVAKWLRDDELRGNKYVYKDESELEAAVELALAYDPRVNSFDIHTDAIGNLVTLRGVVDNLGAKRAAEQDARNTVGVYSVKNRIKVRPADSHSDEEIEARVAAALRSNAFVDRYDVTVSAFNGVVHLYGTVDSYLEKTQVDDTASKVNGVVDVKNYLTVEHAEAYSYNPYVDNWNVYDYDWHDSRPQFTTKMDGEIAAE